MPIWNLSELPAKIAKYGENIAGAVREGKIDIYAFESRMGNLVQARHNTPYIGSDTYIKGHVGTLARIHAKKTQGM